MRRLLPAVAVVALLFGGCGIPEDTTVVPIRPGPSPGVTAGGDLAPERPGRTDTLDRAQFVRNYLQAAAGDLGGAADRVKQFLSENAAANFKPVANDIMVVREVEEPLVQPGSAVVTLRMQEVGTLGPKGVLEPSSNAEVRPYEFTLSSVEGQQGLFVTKAPPGLLLSDVALETFFAPRTIYFWNQENTGLVPDLRYMPRSVNQEQQPTVIVDWLTSDPAPWLAGVAESLPEGTKLIGNIPAVSNDTLQINLNAQSVGDDPGAIDRLQKQLRWSLRPNLPETLELSIEHQTPVRFVGDDYLAINPAHRVVDQPERFAVYQGRVHRLARSYRADQPVPVLAPEANKNIRSAALATAGSRSYAALVTNEAGGRQALRVGAAGNGEQGNLRRLDLSGTIGRPDWSKSPVGADAGTFGLVPAGGKLFSFRSNGTGQTEVEWPGGPGGITAVSVAPDSHRVALLAGGRLYVAAISNTEDGTQLSNPHVVVTELNDLTAVAWGSQGVVVVSGTQPETGRVAMMDVSIDGASQNMRLGDLGSLVTHLVALPADPVGDDVANAVGYVLNGAAFDGVNPDRLEARDLADPPADPPADVFPTAPFFLS